MPQADINLTAVLVAAVINMVLGSIWYLPAVFGNAWMKALDKKKDEMSGNPTSAMVLMFIGALVMSYVLAHFVDYTFADTFAEGAQTGFWAWLGFLATMSLATVGFEGRSWNLWLINNGYQLVALVIMGGLLAVWK